MDTVVPSETLLASVLAAPTSTTLENTGIVDSPTHIFVSGMQPATKASDDTDHSSQTEIYYKLILRYQTLHQIKTKHKQRSHMYLLTNLTTYLEWSHDQIHEFSLGLQQCTQLRAHLQQSLFVHRLEYNQI